MNIHQLMKQAKKMQKQMEKAQQELEQTRVTGTAGGGVVKVTMNGKNELLDLQISPEVVDPDDVEMLQDLIIAAYQDAAKQIEEIIAKERSKLAGGLNIPGLF